MDELAHLLLEDPTWLYVVCAIVAAAMLISWYARRTRRAALQLLVPAGLAAVVFAVSTLVVTDRERLREAIDEMARGANQGTLEPVRPYLEAEVIFRGRKVAAEDALEEASDALERRGVIGVRVSGMTIGFAEPASDDAPAARTAEMAVAAWVSLAGGGKWKVAVTLHWVKRPAGWRIVRVEKVRQAPLLE